MLLIYYTFASIYCSLYITSALFSSVSGPGGAESAIFEGVFCESAEIFGVDLVLPKAKTAPHFSNSDYKKANWASPAGPNQSQNLVP